MGVYMLKVDTVLGLFKINNVPKNNVQTSTVFHEVNFQSNIELIITVEKNSSDHCIVHILQFAPSWSSVA